MQTGHFLYQLSHKQDFLNKITQISIIPKETLFIIMNAEALCSNIKHKEVISAFTESFNKKPTNVTVQEIAYISHLNDICSITDHLFGRSEMLNLFVRTRPVRCSTLIRLWNRHENQSVSNSEKINLERKELG